MKSKRWVIKVGSQMVTQGGPILLRAWMHQVRDLKRKHQIEVVWVTSGAISSAVQRTNFKKNKAVWSLSEKQALSAIGQPILMDLYNLALTNTGLSGAQVLLTASDLNDNTRRNNFKATVEQLLKWQVIPLLNENDVVATEEIKFGDNDSLSAQVAGAVGASKLIILTDVEGYYDSDPRKNRKAKLISELKNVTPKVLKDASPTSGSHHGTGGMFSKLKAAKIASHLGIQTHLAKGDTPNVLLSLARGDLIGTSVKAHVLRKKG
jgi:glutamate 5-kinase